MERSLQWHVWARRRPSGQTRLAVVPRVEPNSPNNPILGLLIADNTIVDNVHEGVAPRLRPQGTLTAHADHITITGNTIAGNNPYGGAQLALNGGQPTDPGHVLIANNRFQAGAGAVRVVRRAERLSGRLTEKDAIGR